MSDVEDVNRVVSKVGVRPLDVNMDPADVGRPISPVACDRAVAAHAHPR